MDTLFNKKAAIMKIIPSRVVKVRLYIFALWSAVIAIPLFAMNLMLEMFRNMDDYSSNRSRGFGNNQG